MLCFFHYPHHSYIFSNSAIIFSEMKGKKGQHSRTAASNWKKEFSCGSWLGFSGFQDAPSISDHCWELIWTFHKANFRNSKNSFVSKDTQYEICKFGIVLLQIHLDMTKLSFTCHYPVSWYWELLPLNSPLSSHNAPQPLKQKSRYHKFKPWINAR